VEVRAVTDAAAASGVPHGEALVAFADALVGEDEEALERARTALLEALGPAGFVDAAAVASNFERMVRVADATGIPLDAPVRVLAADLRDDLSLDALGSAANTPALTRSQRALGRTLRPVARSLLRLAFRRARA
jgi:hypothetical protein